MTGTESAAIRQVYREIERVAVWDVTVVLRGERGTGKADCALRLHRASRRSHLPFERVSLSALSRDRLETELFGHVRGAYTGAQSSRDGIIGGIGGGTICLDEVGKSSLAFQEWFLDYLDTTSFRRMGADARRSSDARLVFTANEDLERLVATGRMLPDFLDRLGMIHIQVPPLRDRREDIVPLLRHFLRRCLADHGKDAVRTEPMLAPELVEFLVAYTWPGNVRQLEMTAQALLAFSGGAKVLDCSMLPAPLREMRSNRLSPEQRRREDAAQACSLLLQYGTMRKAAAAAGKSPTTFRRLIRSAGSVRSGESAPGA